jgi:hypothetical protein
MSEIRNINHFNEFHFPNGLHVRSPFNHDKMVEAGINRHDTAWTEKLINEAYSQRDNFWEHVKHFAAITNRRKRNLALIAVFESRIGKEERSAISSEKLRAAKQIANG